MRHPSMRLGHDEVRRARHGDEHEHDRRGPDLMPRRARRRERRARPGDVDRLEREPQHGADVHGEADPTEAHRARRASTCRAAARRARRRRRAGTRGRSRRCRTRSGCRSPRSRGRAAGRRTRRTWWRRARRSAPGGGRRGAGSRAPGSVPSRETEKIARAVAPCAAIPQARKATRTTAANGLLDQSPNEPTTAVLTGSTSRPATTSSGAGCASVTASPFRSTSAPTLSSATQTAVGTCRAASRVSSAVSTHASKPMNAHPATASAASIAPATEPPERPRHRACRRRRRGRARGTRAGARSRCRPRRAPPPRCPR